MWFHRPLTNRAFMQQLYMFNRRMYTLNLHVCMCALELWKGRTAQCSRLSRSWINQINQSWSNTHVNDATIIESRECKLAYVRTYFRTKDGTRNLFSKKNLILIRPFEISENENFWPFENNPHYIRYISYRCHQK